MKRKRPAQDSLELFLDAICNMFGGFIFLMLFVVVTLRTTSERTIQQGIYEDGMTVAEYETLELELDELKWKWNSVSELLEESRKFVDSLTSQEVKDAHAGTLATLDELKDEETQIEEFASEVARIEKRALELDVARREANLELENAKKDVRNAQIDAEATERASANVAAPPQMRERGGWKDEVAVVLKYGKLYFWHEKDTRELNTDDFYVVEDSLLSTRVEPRLEAGIDLKSPGVVKRLDAAFAPYSAALESVAIVVADDSYDEYAVLRDFLKERLYEIRPIIGEKGDPVYDRGGTNTMRQ